jgi:hypothetical protein
MGVPNGHEISRILKEKYTPLQYTFHSIPPKKQPGRKTIHLSILSLFMEGASASIRSRPGRQPAGKTIDPSPLNHGPTPFLQVSALQHRDFARRRQCRFGFGAVSRLRQDHEIF